MSSSIRPPGGRPPGLGPLGPSANEPGLRGAGQTDATRAATHTDSAAQNAASQGAQSRAAQGGATQSAAATAQWIRRLEAGEITRTQAIEGLVAQAVEQRGGSRLTPALRGELESVLRAALLGDPVLGRLLGDA